MAREIEYRPGHYYPKGTFTESEVRDIVGAPTREEEEMCVCGDRIEDCKTATNI